LPARRSPLWSPPAQRKGRVGHLCRNRPRTCVPSAHAKLLQKYGGLLVTAAVAVVLAVGGWQAWRYYEARETARVAQNYLAR